LGESNAGSVNTAVLYVLDIIEAMMPLSPSRHGLSPWALLSLFVTGTLTPDD
jgi:hypothetical protein